MNEATLWKEEGAHRELERGGFPNLDLCLKPEMELLFYLCRSSAPHGTDNGCLSS